MWNDSHADETWIDCLKRYLRKWKRSTGYSDATICDEIVKAHDEIGLAAKTGIRFSPGSADEYNRKKANAARIMRMLSDEPSTDGEAVAAINMLPSILAAMPADLRIGFLNEYIAPLNLSVRGTEIKEAGELNATARLINIAREASEAQAAVADLIDGATHEELVRADRELAEAEDAFISARAAVRKQMLLKAVA
jgi:hypothetical protein